MKDKSKIWKIIKKVIGTLIFLIVLFFLVRFIWNNRELFSGLKDISPFWIIILLALTILQISTNVMVDYDVAKALDADVKLLDAEYMVLVPGVMNLVMPMRAGYLLKAGYYKKVCALSYSRFVSMTGGTMIIQIIITLLTGVGGFLFLKYDAGIAALLFLALLAVVAAGYLILLYGKKTILKILPFKKRTLPVMEAFYILIEYRFLIIKCIFWFLLNNFVAAIRFAIVFKALGGNVSVFSSLLYDALYTASSYICIIPSNIGLGESMIGYANNVLGENFEIGVAATLIYRVVGILSYFAGALIMIGIMQLRKYIDKRKNSGG